MTVSTTAAGQDFFGNGTTTTFPCGFKVFDETHLEVYLDGVLQTLSTHYSVSGVGNDVTDVVFVTAPPDPSTVSVFRKIPLTQEVDYLSNDEFPAETHERALDLAMMGVQQVDTLARRAVRALDGDPANIDMRLPAIAARSGKLLSFDTAGQPVVAEGTEFGLLTTAEHHNWLNTQTIKVADGTDGWRMQDLAGNDTIKMRSNPAGSGKMSFFDTAHVERVVIDPHESSIIRVEADVGEDGFLLQNLSESSRVKIRIASSGAGRIEIFDASGVLRAAIDPADDPLFKVQAASGKDGITLQNQSGATMAKMRVHSDGHGAVEVRSSAGNAGQMLAGSGTPEGARTAPVGSIYLRTDGGANTTLYVKESGAGNTGWVGK